MQSEQQQRIMGYFIEEAKDHLNTIEQGLLNLQSTIGDPEMVSEVFRAAHSVKGGAAMLGLGSIQQTSHRLEDYFKVLKECPIKVDQKLESLFLRVFDTLQELLEQLQGPFGLTDDKADEVMAEVEPVFNSLNEHLGLLVSQSGATPPEDVELVTVSVAAASTSRSKVQPPAQEESALQLIFKSDVPARLRDMLQLFKQPDNASTRQQLQDICRSLAQAGEQFELPAWSALLNAAGQAVTSPDNTYRTLAPVIIRDIKQAQELVLAGQAADIVPSDSLQALVPVTAASASASIDEPLDDFSGFLPDLEFEEESEPQFIEFDLQTDEQLVAEVSESASTSEVSMDEWLNSVTLSQPDEDSISDFDFELGDLEPDYSGSRDRNLGFDDELDTAATSAPVTDHNGPEVGMAELNSLADLFEGEVPDLGMTWQEEEIITGASGDLSSSQLDASSDFSDLLDDQDSLDDLDLEENNESDDLSDLLSNGDRASSSSDISASSSADQLDELSLSDPADVEHSLDFSLFEEAAALPVETESDNPNAADLDAASRLENLGELFADLDQPELAAADEAETAAAAFNLDDEASEETAAADNPFNLEDIFGSGSEESNVETSFALDNPFALDSNSDDDDGSSLELLPDGDGLEVLEDLAADDTLIDALIQDEIGLELPQTTEAEPVEPVEPRETSEPFASESSAELDPWAALDAEYENEDQVEDATAPLLEDQDVTADLWGDSSQTSPTSSPMFDLIEDIAPSEDLASSETPEAVVSSLDDSLSAEADIFSLDNALDNDSPANFTDPFALDESALEPEALDFIDFDLSEDADPSNAVWVQESQSEELSLEALESDEAIAEGIDAFDFAESPAENFTLDDLQDASDEGSEDAFDFADLSAFEPSAELESLGSDTAESTELTDVEDADLAALLNDGITFEEQPEVTSSEELFDIDDSDEMDLASLLESETTSEDQSDLANLFEDDSSVFSLDLIDEPEENPVTEFEIFPTLETVDGTNSLVDLDLTDSNLFAVEDDFSSDLDSVTLDEAAPNLFEVEDDVELPPISLDEVPNELESDLFGSETSFDLDASNESDFLIFDEAPTDSDASNESDFLIFDEAPTNLNLSNESDFLVFDEASTDLDLSFDAEPEADLDFGSELFGSDSDFSISEASGIASNDAELDSSELGALDFDSLLLTEENAVSETDEVQEELELDSIFSVSDLDEPAAASIDDFADLDAILSEETDSADAATEADEFLQLENFGDLEALLGEESNSLESSELLSTESTDSDDFADLDILLSGDTPDITASGSSSTAAGFDDFADLEALLEVEDAPAPTPLAAPPASAAKTAGIASDFDDLEKLLENADQTLGGPPTNRGARGPSLAANRNKNRPTRGVLSDQTMRVSVKNLDNLNNLVGELVVNRNSLEQAEERLRQFLDNLLYQVQQLSDVGQRMRDLYERSLLESSLLSNRKSYQTSPPGNGGFGGNHGAQSNHATGASFDALEMDRFTGFHTLSQEMIELIVRVRESASDIDFVVDETDQVTRNFRQITTQLQEGLTRARMVPFAQTADRLPRAVRDISLKYGKQAELTIEGRETLIDKMILEQLYDPMTHLVNNAITHGIETSEERIAAGKVATGRITVRTFHQGNQTVISVTDDGAGINPETVKQKAVEKGLITRAESETMSRLDVYDLLFHHGFSTKDKADDFAGRGVGMDVVRTSLNEIRGVINIDSTVGRGTTFTIRLPLTLSISKALCCISNRARIAFPMDGVEDMLDVPKERIQRDEQDRPCIQWRDRLLPFQPLSELLKYNRSLGRGSVYGGNQEEDIVSVVVLRSNAGNYLALQVDQVLGEQEIVIKQLEGPVPKPVGVAGATVLGDGRIMPIADVLELIDLSLGRIRREAGSSLWEKEDDQVPMDPVDLKTEPTVLIVDDSITVRELLSMTFNKIGYRVEQARDGQEAWEKLRSGLPCDIVFCDIEMPRMDGLELLSRIQKDPSLNHLPIAMLTSRGADRHRQMAIQLGAKGYFTKPYLEEALLDAAQRMLKGEILVTSS